MSSCCDKKVNVTKREITDSCDSNKSEAQQTNGCCPSMQNTEPKTATTSCCPSEQKKFDWLLWGGTSIVAVTYVLHLTWSPQIDWLATLNATAFEMMNAMWFAIAFGALAVGWLNRIPRDVVIATLGPGHTKRGLFRATLAGLMLDLCNHGILMVGMKLYERGASLGQVMAFIIASPWNSLTLTIILISLIGLQWTLLFIVLSLVIAWISGYIFDSLEKSGQLPKNPNLHSIPDDFELKPALVELTKNADYSARAFYEMVIAGIKGSRMVIRWIMVGIVMVALVRAFVPPSVFNEFFGPTSAGLLLTLLAATIIEVCSEGSTPIAADLVNRANAPGNSFTFLMAGAATDYTEVMVLKDTTQSWKIALFLPLITVPQVLLIGWLLNMA